MRIFRRLKLIAIYSYHMTLVDKLLSSPQIWKAKDIIMYDMYDMYVCITIMGDPQIAWRLRPTVDGATYHKVNLRFAYLILNLVLNFRKYIRIIVFVFIPHCYKKTWNKIYHEVTSIWRIIKWRHITFRQLPPNRAPSCCRFLAETAKTGDRSTRARAPTS